MKTITIGIAIFVVTLVFINIVIIKTLGIPLFRMGIGNLLLVEGMFAGFFLFLFLLVTRK